MTDPLALADAPEMLPCGWCAKHHKPGRCEKLNWPADLAAREIEQAGHPEPHELMECLFCGEIHTGDCAIHVPAPESYADWRERTAELAYRERDRAPGKW